MAFRILDHLDVDPIDIAVIVSAIGNYDEGTGVALYPISAALIIADKSDVRRSRVRNTDIANFDVYDRVNYYVKNSKISINDEKTIITLNLEIDTNVSLVMEYFEIFLNRMIMCGHAIEALKLQFKLIINNQQIM